MKFDTTDMYAALMHELKNNLGLLTMTLDAIPLRGDAEHDGRLDDARLLCQRSIERLQQALLIYKAANAELHPVVDAYCPSICFGNWGYRPFPGPGSPPGGTLVGDQVPDLWFFDRALVEMAMINAIHNSLSHARSTIRIEADMVDGCLAFIVRDDSVGYPDHILAPGPGERVYSSRGTGLGLMFARLIAEAHENQGRIGELRLFNENGAVFQLYVALSRTGDHGQ
jgi:signal transduction histidine kinase